MAGVYVSDRMLPIFYVNLAKRADRRAFMEDQFQALDLAFTRVEAVTPTDISASEADRYCNPNRRSYLRKNQLACTKSHEKVWTQFLEGSEPWCLVLEDDMWLSPALSRFLSGWNDVPSELVRIETTGSATRVLPVTLVAPDGTALRPFRSTPLGSGAYLISRSGAKKLLGHPALRDRPIDLVLFDPFEEPGRSLDRVLTVPAFCKQLGLMEAESEAGRSDIVGGEPHHFADRHPVRYRLANAWQASGRGLRNAFDHWRQHGKGLERVVIPLAE